MRDSFGALFNDCAGQKNKVNCFFNYFPELKKSWDENTFLLSINMFNMISKFQELGIINNALMATMLKQWDSQFLGVHSKAEKNS